MKAIIIVIIAVILMGSLVYLTLLIQDGSNPLGMFGIRASNEEDEFDPFLEKNNIPSDTSEAPIEETGDPMAPQETSPSPTETLVAYNSTSPTLSPGAGGSAALTVTSTPSPSSIKILTPSVFNFAEEESILLSPPPTVVKTLPVSGFTDHLDKFIIGAGVLILLGLLL